MGPLGPAAGSPRRRRGRKKIFLNATHAPWMSMHANRGPKKCIDVQRVNIACLRTRLLRATKCGGFWNFLQRPRCHVETPQVVAPAPTAQREAPPRSLPRDRIL